MRMRRMRVGREMKRSTEIHGNLTEIALASYDTAFSRGVSTSLLVISFLRIALTAECRRVSQPDVTGGVAF